MCVCVYVCAIVLGVCLEWIYCRRYFSFGKTHAAQSCTDGVMMTGKKRPDTSVLCQGISERLLRGCGVEKVSLDAPCHTWNSLHLDAKTKQHSNQPSLLTGMSLLV